MKRLTTKQQAVLDFIKGHIELCGCPPTNFEISHNFGWASDNAANEHLKALQRKGFVTVARGVSRGIKIVGAAGPDAEKMARALRVIRTWAQFDIVEKCQRALIPEDVMKFCDEALS